MLRVAHWLVLGSVFEELRCRFLGARGPKMSSSSAAEAAEEAALWAAVVWLLQLTGSETTEAALLGVTIA